MTFLSIVTRCHPNRPGFLAENEASVAAQTCNDYEHIFIVDDEGRGVAWANWALQLAQPAGDYVLVLDDDDKLTDPEAIAKLKEATADNPDLVIFKADHDGLGILPSPLIWGRAILRGHIGSCDFITSREQWYQHIHHFAQPECGDFSFLNALWFNRPEVVWLDEQLAAVQRISKGAPE